MANWWRGGAGGERVPEPARRAVPKLVDLYSADDLDAELPSAVARVQATLHRDDPRCVSQTDLRAMKPERRRAWLRRLVEDGYEAIDLKHAQLRSFRNNVLRAAVLVSMLVAVTVFFVSRNPTVMPLCFPHEVANAAGSTMQHNFNCPTRTNTKAGPTGGDVWAVALLGLLGGALAATVAIRKLRGTSTPYDVPVALAWLKVPLGAFTSILGIVAIHGGFVPGLSVLDSQEQILAYALLLGFAQQAFTGVLDRQAQSLLTDVPSKESQPERRAPGTGSLPTPQTTEPEGEGKEAEPRNQPAPSGGDGPTPPSIPRSTTRVGKMVSGWTAMTRRAARRARRLSRPAPEPKD